MMTVQLDDKDRRILFELQRNARISNAEIGRRVGLVPSAIHERIKKLEERGVIMGYETRVNPSALGYGLLAYVFARDMDGAADADIQENLAKIQGVQEVHTIAGDDCHIMKVRAKDTNELGRLVTEAIKAVPGVANTRTTIVLGTGRESISIPIDGLSASELLAGRSINGNGRNGNGRP